MELDVGGCHRATTLEQADVGGLADDTWGSAAVADVGPPTR
jgi:hypothetical protein